MRYRLLAAALAAVLSLAAVAPAIAGGWAFAELVSPVDAVVAGKPVQIELRVLGHGVPDQVSTTGSPLSIVATHRESGAVVKAEALPDMASRTYRATMTFPTSGAWKWTATDGGWVGLTSLPQLQVCADAAEIGTTGESGAGHIVRVTVRDGAFEIPDTPIHVGDTIEWTNEGALSHIVMASDSGFEDVPLLQPGETYRTAATVAGTFGIFCTPHTGMVARLVIEP